jgi:hypothetical protein
VVPDGDGPEN